MTETITSNQIEFSGTTSSLAFVPALREHEHSESAWWFDPIYYTIELARRSNHVLRNIQAYQRRIGTLKSYAEMDNINVSDKSEQDFWKFILSMPLARKANVVVTDNGNLRVVWRRGRDEHLGIEFLGDHRVEYVMWRTESLEPTAGRDMLEGMRRRILVSGLMSILE